MHHMDEGGVPIPQQGEEEDEYMSSSLPGDGGSRNSRQPPPTAQTAFCKSHIALRTAGCRLQRPFPRAPAALHALP